MKTIKTNVGLKERLVAPRRKELSRFNIIINGGINNVLILEDNHMTNRQFGWEHHAGSDGGPDDDVVVTP